MKQIVTLFGLLALASLLMQSCGMNVVKRQHNKGYHIEFASRHKVQKNDADATALRQSGNKEIAPASEAVKQNEAVRENEVAVNAEPAKNEIRTTDEQIIASAEPVTSENLVSEAAPGTVKKAHLNGKFVNTIMDHTPIPKVLKSKVKSIQQGESSAREGGLSLFWIVILVILILWALGYWGRWIDGGLIHLLLLIALILLILWLLGLI